MDNLYILHHHLHKKNTKTRFNYMIEALLSAKRFTRVKRRAIVAIERQIFKHTTRQVGIGDEPTTECDCIVALLARHRRLSTCRREAA
jgi:hypothetical protein